jgi:hypothetical protein
LKLYATNVNSLLLSWNGELVGVFAGRAMLKFLRKIIARELSSIPNCQCRNRSNMWGGKASWWRRLKGTIRVGSAEWYGEVWLWLFFFFW